MFDSAYPDQSQRLLVLDLAQTLWDRSDPNGYASHMTGGLPDTVKAFGIDSRSGLAHLFATHPPIEVRIAALQAPAQ